MIEVKIENIIAIKIFIQKFILSLIVTHSKEVEYKPKKLPDLAHTLKESTYRKVSFWFLSNNTS